MRQEIVHRFSQCRMTEQRGDKFTRTVRFIAGGKSARKCQDLCRFHRFDKRFHRFIQRLRRQVAHDDGRHIRARIFKCAGRVHFTVRTRHHRNDDLRRANGSPRAACRIVRHRRNGIQRCRLKRFRREYFFQRLFPTRLQCIER